MTADGRRITGLQAVLVGNNSYGRAMDVAHPARRERLDRGSREWCASGSAAPPKRHARRAGRAPAARPAQCR